MTQHFGLVEALEALGVGGYRSEFLAYAARTDEFTAQMVQGALGGSRSAIGEHLRALTQSRILHRVPRLQSHSRGLIYWWVLDPDRSREVIEMVSRGLVERPSPTTWVLATTAAR